MRKLFFLLLAAAFTTLTSHALIVTNTAGHLAEAVDEDVDLTTLVISGTVDARDFLFITESLDEITSLDMSQATIVPYDKGTALYGTVSAYRGNEIPRTAFFGKKLTSVRLPNNLETIGYAAFAGCYQLRSITLPATVTSIDDYAFSGSALTSIELPSTILNMGKGVFSRCENLTSAVINSSFIGDYAFLGDYRLSNVNVGANVKHILKGVFNGCTALKTINFDPACNLSRIDEEAFINSGLENIDIAAMGIGSIGDWALAQTRLASVNLPNGMTQLGEGALSHNPLLSYVKLPGMAHDNTSPRYGAPAHGRTLNRISDFTFAGDEHLNAGNMLRNGVAHIGNYAFYNVSQEMDTMRLPSSVAYLGDRAMAGMIGMQTLKTGAVDVPALGNEVWAGVDQPSVPLITPDSESAELYKAADQWMNFFFEAGDDYLLGDVNGDGNVNIADVTALIDYLLSGNGDVNIKAADVNIDGAVNIADVTALIDRLLTGAASKSLKHLRAMMSEVGMSTSDAMSMAAVTLRPGETRTVDVALNNSEHEYVATQLEVVLPHGVKLVNVKGVDRGEAYGYYSINHEVEQNVYTIIGVSLEMKSYAGEEGNIMRLTIEAGDEFNAQDAELLLTNVMLVTPEHKIYLAGDALAKVNDGSGVEQIAPDKQVASIRYINVAGQESEMPFDGINIVVTTYTDGTSSTVKVIK